MDKSINLNSEHWTVTAIKLNGFTDALDTPVHKSEFFLFEGEIEEDIFGSIFFLENELEGNAFVILVDSPDYEKAKLIVTGYTATVKTTSKVTVIPCKKGECDAVCRKAIRETMKYSPLFAMSNTWGDCNGFSKINEEFILREIDKAAEFGLNIVQIDDGWQFGSTADPNRRDGNGLRVFADDFWLLNEERFPHGMKYIADYAQKKGITLGLWFAPESKNHFECLERDIKILKNAYDNWGIRYFKLDMYRIENDTDREKFSEYLKAINSFGDDISVQLDVTLDNRVNYLFNREYCTVFVENRYTETITYFPHRTLKNLWMLSRYIPASHLQFELVNPELNADKYAKNDAFATPLYDIEYLFASVMLSNPLFWMELQNLSKENTERLRKIISFWQNYKTIFAESDISPIGERPSGRSLTGFHIKHKDGEYALIFREVTDSAFGSFNIHTDKTEAEVLLSNNNVTVQINSGILSAEFSTPRTFAFIKIR